MLKSYSWPCVSAVSPPGIQPTTNCKLSSVSIEKNPSISGPNAVQTCVVQGLTVLNLIYPEGSFYGVSVDSLEGKFRRRGLQGVEDLREGWRWRPLPSKSPWSSSGPLERSWSCLFSSDTVSTVIYSGHPGVCDGSFCKELVSFLVSFKGRCGSVPSA